MKSFLTNTLLVLMGTAVVVYGYQTYVVKKPCAAPLEYRIGTIDPRFGVSEAALMKDLEQAAQIWDDSLGKPLFVYNPHAELAVNLVYDTRQAKTQKELVLKSTINEAKQTADSAKQEFVSLKARYAQLSLSYTQATKALEAAQEPYDTQVAYWNARGGAPQEIFTELRAKKVALEAQQTAVEAKRQEVNALAQQMNALIDKYNLLVDHINTNVQAINTDGLAGTEFEEGVYISDAHGQRINIYQFDDQTTFVRVLAHELGHALGLEHNANPSSIMSPVNQGTSLHTSADDLAALKTLCGIK